MSQDLASSCRSTVLAKNSAKEHDTELPGGGQRREAARALEELYLGYHRRLARFLSRFTPRYENVEEIINDTFMIVWQSAKDFRYASQVSTWIIGIAYRTALKSLRRQKNHSAARSLDDLPEQTIDPTGDTEVQDWLKHGLNQLPMEQRLTLEAAAYHYGAFRWRKSQTITECPVGTVKARMFHASARSCACTCPHWAARVLEWTARGGCT